MFFNRYEALTDDGNALIKQVEEVLGPIFQEWRDRGHTIRAIGQVVALGVGALEAKLVLCAAIEQASTTINEDLFRSVDDLDLSVRAANALARMNITLIGELVQRTEQDMLWTKITHKSLKEIKEILANMGLSLGMKIDNWPQLLERWRAQHQETVKIGVVTS